MNSSITESFDPISTNRILEDSIIKVHLDGFCEVIHFLAGLFIISSLHFWEAGLAVGWGHIQQKDTVICYLVA